MLTEKEREALITRLSQFPLHLMRGIAGLTSEQLQTPVSQGKWTVEQIVHHITDTNLVAFSRMKCVLTENEPDLMFYDQDLWAKLPDSHKTPVEFSTSILLGLHNRWTALLRNLDDSHWQRAGTHPRRGRMTIDDMLAHYVTHGESHLKTILDLRNARKWPIPDHIDSIE